MWMSGLTSLTASVVVKDTRKRISRESIHDKLSLLRRVTEETALEKDIGSSGSLSTHLSSFGCFSRLFIICAVLHHLVEPSRNIVPKKRGIYEAILELQVSMLERATKHDFDKIHMKERYMKRWVLYKRQRPFISRCPVSN